ncbi:MAG: shikimate dehydrogenase [Candidatus Dormibacteria bacterium]|jgi:shikimate dehydrogenase
MPLVAPPWLQFGLIGSGIGHSPSPAMQRAALRAREIQGDYTLLDVTPAELPGLLRQLRGRELAGCNVTVPYKTALATACDRLEGDASICQAVNTLLMRDEQLIGENTDARGFELALGYQRLRPEPGGSALVLGAGGAATACVLALCRMRVDEVVVVARRLEQAEELCLRVSPEAARPLDWHDAAGLARAAREAGTFVNAASVGLAAAPISLEALPSDCVVVDLRYRPRPVDLVAAARDRGLRATDGAEMLLFQGMLSFQHWTGVDPPWHAARAALEEALAA